MFDGKLFGIYEHLDLELCVDSLESDADVDKLISFRRDNVPGLFLSGLNGVGKTLLGSSVLYREYQRGYLVYRTTFYEAIKLYTDDWEFPGELSQPAFLFIDEVGKELQKDLGPSLLEKVVRHRIEIKKSTIIATNMPAEKFFDKYGPTIESDIKSHYLRLNFKKIDRRKVNARTRIEKQII